MATTYWRLVIRNRRLEYVPCTRDQWFAARNSTPTDGATS